MKQPFNIIKGTKKLVITFKDYTGTHYFFIGYRFGMPAWRAKIEDAVIFEITKQAEYFRKTLRGGKAKIEQYETFK